jgi:hypothetical protein
MIKNLIEEYKTLTANCANTDYSDKLSVKKHNITVKRMYEIIDSIRGEKTNETIVEFKGLLDLTLNKTNLWAAIHLLERITLDTDLENKAIKIVEAAAKRNDNEAIGYQIWINEWKEKRNK